MHMLVSVYTYTAALMKIW